MTLRQWNGYVVPSGELERALHRRVASKDHISRVVSLCRHRQVAVQAGGNWGFWPLQMSSMFAAVYTFEPDPVSFSALVSNTDGHPNVIRIQAFLGEKRECRSIVSYEGKSGKHHVGADGIIPTLRIDDLGLAVCDLIYLDIEGFEAAALRGALETIKRCRPILAFEDKGHSERYGDPCGTAKAIAESLGYRTEFNSAHDIVMKP